MAFNPFLSMNEPVAPMAAEALNPFMLSDTESADIVTADNPFAANNPFSDLGGGFESSVSDTVPTDIFGTTDLPNTEPNLGESTTNTSSPFDIFDTQATCIDRLVKPTELELITTVDSVYMNQDEQSTTQPPSCPVPPETQNLILSVTGQMEFTSSHLLDRIPPTRTPSPVSVRDIHSPSPTPEPEIIEEQTTADAFDINRNKPTRPPPARPPPVPRPPPPRPAPPPQISQTQQAQPPQPATAVQTVSDEINLFDAPIPVTVKPTKEAILSLYSLPVKEEEKQIDFLSDDIIEEMPTSVANENVSQDLNEMTTNISKEDSGSTDKIEEELKTTPKEPNVPKASNNDYMFPVSLSEQMDTSEPLKETSALSTTSSPFAGPDGIQDQQISEQEINPFGNAEIEDFSDTYSTTGVNIFGVSQDTAATNVEVFGIDEPGKQTEVAKDTEMAQTHAFTTEAEETFGSNTVNAYVPHETEPTTETDWGIPKTAESTAHNNFPESQDAFDAFSAKFDSTSTAQLNAGAWGDVGGTESGPNGFESEAFDPFLSMGAPPPPTATPRLEHQGSRDSTDDTFSVFIKPKENEWSSEEAAVPALAPPPRPQAFAEPPRVNPFDQTTMENQHRHHDNEQTDGAERGGDETPPTPLFDDDVSVPLEDFPRTTYAGPGWEMQLRQPNKKKITGQRFWKKIFVRLAYQGDNPVVQLLNSATDKEPFQELPLQACYSVSEIGAQQFDQFGKIFTVKLQYVFYKERPGVRPGQVTKAERITNKLSQFAAYAIQGDYQGVKEFGSDLRKLGLPVEHAPQVSQLFKLGSLVYEDVKQFSCSIEEALFRLAAHRDRALTYKMEEVQITAVDELYVEQDAEGSVLKQIARVRLFFLGFLSGMPDVELGVNDLRRQGREVVGRHDIIPVATEEWIRVEAQEFHACVQPEEFANTQIIKFKPPDACYIELMRFRVRPPKNRELPLQLKASWCVTGNRVELRADVLVPGFASRKLGQVPCEDVAIRFPIPECWIYLFRVEKHFRYGSVKSAHRRTGKIKGIERLLGAVDTPQESLIEVTSGQAKYEHQHRAIVWRMPRLPKEGQGAYTTHNLVSRMALTSYDQIPAELARWAYVEFTMPATQVSHTTVRSVSLQNHDSDEPPEKYVRYLARHEYKVGIERTSGQAAPAYAITTAPTAPAPAAPAPAPAPAPPSSDSDSD